MSLDHPALTAMLEMSSRHLVVVRWPDGEEALLALDSPVQADETDDGEEEWLVDVVELRTPGRRLAGYSTWIVRSDDPPIMVMSPDRARVWTAQQG